MNDASSQREPIAVPMETQPKAVAHPSASAVSPIWRVSPNHNGSTLYDSFELQAVTKQLNKAIQGSNGPLSPYSYYLRSPFYRRRVDRIYRDSAKTPRRITSRRMDTATVDDARGTRGFVMRIWKKVKRGLLWNK